MLNQTEGGFSITEGDPWPNTKPGVSFGWVSGGNLIYSFGETLTPNYALAAKNMTANIDARIRVTLYAEGPYFGILVKGTGFAFGAGFTWTEGEEMHSGLAEPLVVDGNRLAWRMLVIDQGIVTRMRTFTTDPKMTWPLLNVRGEWLARGPLSKAESHAVLAKHTGDAVAGVPVLCSSRMRPDARDFNI